MVIFLPMLLSFGSAFVLMPKNATGRVAGDLTLLTRYAYRWDMPEESMHPGPRLITPRSLLYMLTSLLSDVALIPLTIERLPMLWREYLGVIFKAGVGDDMDAMPIGVLPVPSFGVPY